MAIVLEINILCNKLFDAEIIEEVLNDYDIYPLTAYTIDNWSWENKREVGFLNPIKDFADGNKILIMQLKKNGIKDLGIYIEKRENGYLYTLWINTEGYPMLDCDLITSENRKYYEEIYGAISKLNKRIDNNIKAVGVGLETDFYYDENLLVTIQNSRNIVAWMINSDCGMDTVNGYKEKITDETDMTILEKIKQ